MPSSRSNSQARVLLRHQPALEPVGETGDDALQMRELLVEIGAQALQLVMIAEVFGGDDLVELRREGVVFRPARLVLAVRIRPRRLARRLVVAEFAVVEGVGGRGLRAFHRALAHLLARRLGLISAHLLRGVGIGRALGAGLIVVAVLVLVVLVIVFAVGAALVADLERRQEIMHGIAEPGLVLDHGIEPVEPPADLVFEDGTPEIDHLLGSRGRRHAGQAFAHQHRQRVGERRVGAIGDLVELAAMEMVVEHRGEVFRNARHAPRADRLDPGLLHRLEHAARLRIAGHQLAMQLRIVTGELERDRVGMAAHDRCVTPGHLSRGFGQPRLARREPGTLGGEADVELGRLGNRLQAGGHRALERLGRSFLGVAEFGVGGGAHLDLTVVPAKAGIHSHRRLLRQGKLSASLHRETSQYGSRLSPGRHTERDQLSATFTADSGSSALKQRW
ncbi:hypothetical protein ACVWWO_004210 [Bradyrhizobium sp. F1.13.1]